VKARTTIELLHSTNANASATLTSVQGLLAGKVLFAQDAIPAIAVSESGQFVVRGDTRFMVRAVADTYRLAVVTLWTGNNKILAGSRVTTHNCSHDDVPATPCVIDASAVK
jgi:hypothetical protein